MTAVETRDGLSRPEGEAEPRDTEVGFLIGDERYEIPTLDTITLDEERILYLYADTVLQDFAPPHPEQSDDDKRVIEFAQFQKVRNPDFKRALAHIAYRRRHPKASDAEIQKALGEVRALEVDHAIGRGGRRPPETSSQTPLESERNTNTPSRPTDSGSPTVSALGPVVESPLSTGTTR